jgi:hypothetical protein
MAKKLRKIQLPSSLRRLYPQVERAYDADRPVEVSVGPKDCKDAKRLNPTECALAIATRRELKADAVIIGMSTSYIIKGNQAFRYATPESVAREIVSFDRHADFAPGDYHLAVKAPTAKFGASRANKGGVNKTARRHHVQARVRVLPTGHSSE